MNILLERAQQSAKKAAADIEFKRLDRAYIEWLVSSDVLLEVIPRHRSYPDLNTSRGDLLNKYRSLYKVRDLTIVCVHLDCYPTICSEFAMNQTSFYSGQYF